MTVFKKALEVILNDKKVKYSIIFLWYLIGVSLCYFVSFCIRFDGYVDSEHLAMYAKTLPILLIISFVIFKLCSLYSGLWRYTHIKDVPKAIVAVFLIFSIFGSFLCLLHDYIPGFPRSVLLISANLLLLWMLGGRFLFSFLIERIDLSGINSRTHSTNTVKKDARILLLGHLNYINIFLQSVDGLDLNGLGRIAGIITNDASAKGATLHKIPVFGDESRIEESISDLGITTVLCLPPYTSKFELNKIVKNVKHTHLKCEFRMIPSLSELAISKFEISDIRKVEIEDLLGRAPVNLDHKEVLTFVQNRSIMVTGAGGSIGSELCRQLITYPIVRLVLFEMSEIALFNIHNELIELNSGIEIVPVAGDVREYFYLETSVQKYKPSLIYHAAAYKHVPLMEQNVPACFHTNVIGAENIAKIAEEFDSIQKVVLISSDKAVRPTSIMGTTKRIAEKILIENKDSKCTAVRFGNVLGSSGSVIPHFKKQIDSGGPVTVTTKKMTRFFMTIPEAVSLVLMAGTVGQSNEIMVLEMGDSVKIYDLAKNLIELSGFIPEEEIKIEFTGIRPGEKEYEELLTDDENVIKTRYEKIWIMEKNKKNKKMDISIDEIFSAIKSDDAEKLKELAIKYVPDCSLKL